MFHSLRTRLTLIFIGLAVAPSIAVSAILGQRSFVYLEQEAISSQIDKAQLVGTEVRAFIREHENELNRLGDVRSINRLDVPDQKALLSSLLSSVHDYQELILLDSVGEEVIRLSRSEVIDEDELISHSNTQDFLYPKATGEIYYSSVRFEEPHLEPLLTIAVPIFDARSGDLSMVIIAHLRLKTIWELFSSLDYQGGEDIFMIDSSGRVVAHRNPSIVLRETTFRLSAEQGRTTGLSGTDVIFAANRVQIGNEELIVVAERPFDEAAALALSISTITAVVTLIALMFAIVVGIVTVRQIVGPVERLSHVAQAIAKGDLSQRMEVDRKDEIGELAQSFNSMTTQLQDTLESERAARHEAQEANRLKDLFLATMSHELRTPLNAIIGFLGLILYSEQLDEDNTHMANRAMANSNRLLGLINNILDLSRIASGRLEITPVPMSFSELAEAIRRDMEQQLKEKNLAFKMDIDPDLPAQTFHDEERLTQIITNLLGNAIKFTNQGEVRLALRRNEGRLQIEVSDTGIGIPFAKQEIIFNEFTQLDSGSARKYGGAGLGLSIVKRLSMLMGGGVKVSSDVGKGTTFMVDLPLKLAVEAASHVAREEM
ncbi:MAG: HAMP domain-containing protein [Anaerolineae bacterium]|nr:HAMP domain-containing protein [Anaerolineae bacterium]